MLEAAAEGRAGERLDSAENLCSLCVVLPCSSPLPVLGGSLKVSQKKNVQRCAPFLLECPHSGFSSVSCSAGTELGQAPRVSPALSVGLVFIVCHQGSPKEQPEETQNLTSEFQTVKGALQNRTPVSSLLVQMVDGVPARTWCSTSIFSARDLSFAKRGFVL